MTELSIRTDDQLVADYYVTNAGQNIDLIAEPFTVLSLETRKLSQRGGDWFLYADPAVLVPVGDAKAK